MTSGDSPTIMNEPTPQAVREAPQGSDQRQSHPRLNRTIKLAETIARILHDVVRTTFPRLC